MIKFYLLIFLGLISPISAVELLEATENQLGNFHMFTHITVNGEKQKPEQSLIVSKLSEDKKWLITEVTSYRNKERIELVRKVNLTKNKNGKHEYSIVINKKQSDQGEIEVIDKNTLKIISKTTEAYTSKATIISPDVYKLHLIQKPREDGLKIEMSFEVKKLK